MRIAKLSQGPGKREQAKREAGHVGCHAVEQTAGRPFIFPLWPHNDPGFADEKDLRNLNNKSVLQRVTESDPCVKRPIRDGDMQRSAEQERDDRGTKPDCSHTVRYCPFGRDASARAKLISC